MPIFIKTDTDQAMLEAMEIANEIESNKTFAEALALEHQAEQLNNKAHDFFNGSYREVQVPTAAGPTVPPLLHRDAPFGNAHIFRCDSSVAFGLIEGVAEHSLKAMQELPEAHFPVPGGSPESFARHQFKTLNAFNNNLGQVDFAGKSNYDKMRTVANEGFTASMNLFVALGYPLED